MKITMNWGGKEANRIVIENTELESIIQKILRDKKAVLPTLCTVYVHGHELSFPIGDNKSFLQITKELGLPPYLMALGNRKARGYETFDLEGQHDTEIPGRFVIPSTIAVNLVKDFIATKKLPKIVEWEEI